MNCPEIDRPSPSPSYVSEDMDKNTGVYVLNTLLSGAFFVDKSMEPTVSYEDKTKNICPIVFPIGLTELQTKIKYAEKKDETIKGEYLYPIALELAGYRVDELSVEDFKAIDEVEESVIGILYSFTGKDPQQGIAGAGSYTPQIQWTALKRTTGSGEWTAYTPIREADITSLETIKYPAYSSAKTIMLTYFDQLHSIFFVYDIEAKPVPVIKREDYVEIKVFPNPPGISHPRGEKSRVKVSTHIGVDPFYSTDAWMADLSKQMEQDTNRETWMEKDRSYPPYESYRIPIEIQHREEEEEEEEAKAPQKNGGKRSKSRKTRVRGRKTKRHLQR
jgi:hypothetical protein